MCCKRGLPISIVHISAMAEVLNTTTGFLEEQPILFVIIPRLKISTELTDQSQRIWPPNVGVVTRSNQAPTGQWSSWLKATYNANGTFWCLQGLMEYLVLDAGWQLEKTK